MSHELEIVDGVAQMAYAGEKPWHRLGTEVSNDLSPGQIMAKAGLDWSVNKYDSFVDVNGEKISTGKQALVRSSDNKVLTNVGEGWNPVQNADAFDFFSEFVLAGDMEMNTAGSLQGGQMVFALAKIKESFDVFGDDKVDSYLLFSNPHKYGKSIDIRFTPIRVVCNNTLSLSLGSKSSGFYKSGHRSVFDPDQVKEAMGLAHEKFAKYKEMAQFLGSRNASKEALIGYYNDVFPRTSVKDADKNLALSYDTLSRNAQAAYDVLETQPGAQYAEGSWWQALNSVTFITDHVQGRSEDNRLYSSWFGGNQARKVTAVDKAVEYANA